jgi:4-hydroxybenzoate polyprenyltransferase
MTYWKFIRPFTLLVPATGMLAGALMALGADPKWLSDWHSGWAKVYGAVTAGVLLAAALNAFSNGINQIFDIEVDRINKPLRMLPSGRMSLREAWAISLLFLLLALLLAAWINWQCLLIVWAAAVLTYVYSAPPLRTKGRGIWANFTIAIPRGTLLVVCGWSTIKDVLQVEPWFIGAIFGAYILGAATTKDFSDIEGDRLGGCRTLPVRYGVEQAVRIITPFLILPFAMILPGVYFGVLTGHAWLLTALGVGLPLWGAYVVRLLSGSTEALVTPGSSSLRENHPSWVHMYLLTLVAQIGFSVAYLARPEV